jgi:hypothetical protein
VIASLLCLFRGAHDPERIPGLSGFRCARCSRVEADLGAFSDDDRDGFVNPHSKALASAQQHNRRHEPPMAA